MARSNSQSSKPQWQRTMSFVIGLVMEQWFVIAIGIVVAIASQAQVPLSQQHVKQTVVTYLAVSIIFFVTGCTLKTSVLLENFRRWPIHLFIQVQCFLMTSAMIFGIVSAAATNRDFMDPGLLVGMIFLGSVPTTLSSNVIMTGQAGGNTALTVVQTTIGNFIGPFATPALIELYTNNGAWYTDYLRAGGQAGGFGEVYRRVFQQLGLSVYLPMVIGQIVNNVFPDTTKKIFIDWHFKKLSSFALLTIIWQTFDQAFATGAFTSVKSDNIIFIVFINIACFLVWLVISVATSIPWLPKEDVVSVAYCVPAKTPAMGVPISNVMFAGLSLIQESKMQVPMVLFQGLQIAASSVLIPAFKRWVNKDVVHDEESQDDTEAQDDKEGSDDQSFTSESQKSRKESR